MNTINERIDKALDWFNVGASNVKSFSPNSKQLLDSLNEAKEEAKQAILELINEESRQSQLKSLNRFWDDYVSTGNILNKEAIDDYLTRQRNWLTTPKG